MEKSACTFNAPDHAGGHSSRKDDNRINYVNGACCKKRTGISIVEGFRFESLSRGNEHHVDFLEASQGFTEEKWVVNC
jgi:hypothetical protein